ncbi:MAG TPA: HtaA domain-containing protein [Microbacteriaceae bacterium]|nr:HtaA domain-containing protein [Microbacteriaceae bacterium]
MPKPVRAASRFALGAIAALALVFGGLTAPAFADDAPLETPVSESVETPTTSVEEVVSEGEVLAEGSQETASTDEESAEEASGSIVPMSFGTMSVEDDPVASVVAELNEAGTQVTVTGSLPATRLGATAPNVGVEIPLGVYLMWCAEPAEGVRASGALCDSAKQVWIASASAPPATVVGSVDDGWWTFTATVNVTDTFGTHECLADGDEQCGIYVRPDHRFGTAITDLDGFYPVTFDATPAPATATTTVLATNVSTLTVGDSVTVTASVSPIIAAGSVSFTDGVTIVGTAAVSGGVATVTVSPTQGAHSYRAQFVPADTGAYATSTSAAVNVQVNAAPVAASGSLSWGIKASFNSYITTIAAGTISLSGGASSFGSGYYFPQTGGGDWSSAAQLGTVPFAGSVHYYGHSGALDVTFSSPTIVVHSASSATLYMNGVAFANLNLAAASKSVGAGGDVTWSGVPATLTSGGAAAFAGFYNAGDGLDSLTFTAGSAASGIGGGTTVVASAAASTQRTPAPTPPATTGVTVVGGAPTQGGTVTIEASGFQPNEEGILIVIYSDPVVLGTVKADAAGVARWTGKLPTTLSGVHTLTMQGSVSHGTVVTIKPSVVAAAAGSCTISDATLTWGFKESFRAYITSTIANGEWTVADGASYETPEFSWSGTGSLDPETETGDLAFEGSVRFTGHGGALDTTIANPRVVLSADGAVLLLDISGTTQDGSEVNSQSIEFATLDLSAASPAEADGTLTWTAIPAVLTEAGSAAFGTYDAGESLDPLTLVIALPSDCGAVAEDGSAPGPEVTTAIDDQSNAPDLAWLWWLIGGLVVLAIVIAIIVTVVRRRSAQ